MTDQISQGANSGEADGSMAMPAADADASASSGPPVPGEVNVIFRGLFLFVRRPKSIDVFVPNMGDDHVYRARVWLGEVSLKPHPIDQPYILCGVTPGDGCFSSGGLLFDGYDSDATAAGRVFARIVLPRPKEVLSLRPTIDPLGCERDALNLVSGQRPLCVHILRYDSPDLMRVHLFDHDQPDDLPPHDMETVFDPDTGKLKQFINLHIVAEPDRDDMPGHVANGMTELMKLVSGLNGTVLLDAKKTTSLRIPGDDYRAKGFHPYETFNLIETAVLLVQAGRSWRKGKPIFPVPPQPVTRPPLSCLPAVTGSRS